MNFNYFNKIALFSLPLFALQGLTDYTHWSSPSYPLKILTNFPKNMFQFYFYMLPDSLVA